MNSYYNILHLIHERTRKLKITKGGNKNPRLNLYYNLHLEIVPAHKQRQENGVNVRMSPAPTGVAF